MIDLSIVVPIYGNEGNIPNLLLCLGDVCCTIRGSTEVVFVVDGSPDRSQELLCAALPSQPYKSTLISLSRNFGSFSAIRAGLEAAKGNTYAVIAADLQEPPELLIEFACALRTDSCDVCVGKRVGRRDGIVSQALSQMFWWIYRLFVQREMPQGGVDVFACNRRVRDVLIAMSEANSSLIGQLIWTGFRRREIPYVRLARTIGESGWTFRRKWKYMSDSIYSFTDLPIRALTFIGFAGALLVSLGAFVILTFWLAGKMNVPGYTPIMLAILFVGFANFLGLGIVGNYVWRCFENSKARPLNITMMQQDFPGVYAENTQNQSLSVYETESSQNASGSLRSDTL